MSEVAAEAVAEVEVVMELLATLSRLKGQTDRKEREKVNAPRHSLVRYNLRDRPAT